MANLCLWISSAMTLLLFSVGVHAEELPSGLLSTPDASKASTEVAAEGFQEHSAPEPVEEDLTEAELSAGGLLSAGNSKQVAATGATSLRLRRGNSDFRAALAGNYARAAASRAEALRTTVLNAQALTRYEYFFASHWSGFLSLSGRNDRFQGLDLRLSVDPGVAYYLVKQPAIRLWLELGYHLQYDIRHQGSLDEARALGEALDKTEVSHSVRSFVGFEDKINERVAVQTGVEHIQSVTEGRAWRLTWNSSVTSNLTGQLSTAVNVGLRYDHDPLPGIEELDLATSFNLVYSLL